MKSLKARYLVFFQYLGTNYSGVMKAPLHQKVLGVQNYLEAAARKLRPVNEINFSISSRTDSGVHALCNSAHFDVQRRDGMPPFSEDLLVDALNYHLKPEPISVLKAYRMPDNFHARYRAVSRTYMYRLVTGICHHSQLPVFERNLCWPICESPLNIGAMQEAAQLFLGTHDFSAFRSISPDNPLKSPIKTLLQADVRSSSGCFSYLHRHRDLQFWELIFKSKSFLYKQSDTRIERK
nr:PREDICTED: tRNA pseudouridine synthase-like 1 [Latimeria chalumnae]|eukprot:XP_014343847.1 PREDICTED: tRNA pseudouridine synthase-like 1 [Latimeria chalumnae]